MILRSQSIIESQDMNLTHRYAGVSQPELNDTSDELLKRLVHRIARTTGAFRSTTQALLNGADEDPVLRRELLQDMEFELGELQRLLENVTQFRALEKGTFTLRRHELLTGPWLRQIVARWQRTVSDKALAWVVEMPENLPVLDVDADKLEQALNNILGNAVRHTAVGGRIAVKAWSKGSGLGVRVLSSPARLIPDDYDHLCDLFYTGELQGRFPTGVGLGLYVARALVERQSGALRVTQPPAGENAVGFELDLPATAGNSDDDTSLPLDNAAVTNATKSDARKSML